MFGYFDGVEDGGLSVVWVWASYCFSCLLVSGVLGLGFSVLMVCLVLRYGLLVLLELSVALLVF